MKLITKQILLVAGSVLATGLGSLMVLGPEVRRDALENSGAHLALEANRAVEAIDMHVESDRQVVESIASSPLLLRPSERMDYLRKEEVRLRGTLEGLYYNDLGGHSHPAHGREFYIGDRDYFGSVRQGLPVVGHVLLSRSTKQWVDLIVLPIRDQTGALVAALGATIRLDDLQALLNGLRQNSDSWICIFDRNRLPIVCSPRSLQADMMGAGLGWRTDEQGTVVLAQRTFLYRSAYNQPSGWRVVAGQDYHRAILSADSSLVRAVWTALATLAVCLSAAAIASRTSVRPIYDLMGVVQAFRSGDLARRANPTGSDEIADLAMSFNSMADALAEEKRTRDETFAELKSAQEFVQALLDHSSSYILIKDLQGKYLLSNHAANRLVGRNLEGETCDAVLTVSHEDIWSHDLEVVRRRAPMTFEEVMIIGGHKSHQLSSRFPMFNREGEVFAVGVVSTDYTSLKEAQDQLLKLNAELEQRVAMRTSQLETANADLESFAYMVSHDLSNPIRNVVGFAQLLKDPESANDPIQVADYAGRIEKSGQRMFALIDDLLAMARAGKGKLEARTVDLSALVEEIFGELDPTGTSEPSSRLIAKVPPACASPALIRQVLTNLIGNSIKYARPGTPVIVEFGFEQRGLVVTYFVRDNGAGIPCAEMERVFKPFERASNCAGKPGSGIGLATVKRIIEAHCGDVWIESTEGVGTTVFFTLRQTDEALAAG